MCFAAAMHALGVGLPSTFSSVHHGPATTYVGHKTGCRRLDHIGVPVQMLQSALIESFVDDRIDLDISFQDHKVVTLECTHMSKATGSNTSQRPSVPYSTPAVADPGAACKWRAAMRAALHQSTTADDCSAVASSHMHAMTLEDVMRREAIKVFPKVAAPRKPFVNRRLGYFFKVKRRRELPSSTPKSASDISSSVNALLHGAAKSRYSTVGCLLRSNTVLLSACASFSCSRRLERTWQQMLPIAHSCTVKGHLYSLCLSTKE